MEVETIAKSSSDEVSREKHKSILDYITKRAFG
jgi:hypothetical protein